MFNGMMDPEIMKIAQEQIGRMPPAELAKLQQQLMSNPELLKLATEGMKNLRPEDVRNAAEQMKHTRHEDMSGIAEKLAKATPEEIVAMRAQADAHVSYELNASESLKKQGNDLHAHGKYSDAAQKYLLAKANLKNVPFLQSKSLRLACSLNLMSCFLKMKQYEDCVKEGSEVLQYDAENLKGLYRRGQAYKELGNMRSALCDLSKANAISPDDETIADLLRKTKEISKECKLPHASGVVIEEIVEEADSMPSDVVENHRPAECPVMQPEDMAENLQSSFAGISGSSTEADRFQEFKDNPEAIRSFHTFLANANPEALASLSGSGMSPEMIKAMSSIIGQISPEELQKMLELATSMSGTNPFLKPTTQDATNSKKSAVVPQEESESPLATSTTKGNNEASTSSSRSFPSNSELSSTFRIPSQTGDVQEQIRNQMRDPAMRQMFTSMIKNMNPEMMANLSEGFGFKLSHEDAVKAQQAMSSLSPEDLERMMKWAERIQNVADGARKTKNWFLGKPGMILAIAMLILAVVLHWRGYIGG